MATLSEKIEMETAKLATLTKKRDDLDKKIKKVQANLEKYKLIQNSNKYSAIEESAQIMGVSIEDVLAALKSGDMLSLQERMEAAQEKPQEAEVIAVGPGGMVDGKEVTMQVKTGQKVIYSQYAGTKAKLDGEEYIIVRQSDILAVVE